MTDVDQKTGKPVPAKPASAPKPAAAAKPVAAKPAPAAKAPVVKAPTAKAPPSKPADVKPSDVKPTVATPAVAETPVAKTAPEAVKPAAPAAAAPAPKAATPKVAKPAATKPAAKAPAAKVVAPKPVVAKPATPKAATPKPAPVKKPVPAKAAAKPVVHDIAPASLPPVVSAAIAAMEVSKPVVEAPVSSAAAKASTTTPAVPPISLFKVPNMTTTQSFKGFEDITAFGKANLEAFVQANQLFAKGFESLSKEVVSLAQSSLESSTAATKAMFAAKTLKEAAELQADFAKTSFEKLVANSTKIGELTVKLATDSAAPIGARVTAASEKVLKKA